MSNVQARGAHGVLLRRGDRGQSELSVALLMGGAGAFVLSPMGIVNLPPKHTMIWCHLQVSSQRLK